MYFECQTSYYLANLAVSYFYKNHYYVLLCAKHSAKETIILSSLPNAGRFVLLLHSFYGR